MKGDEEGIAKGKGRVAVTQGGRHGQTWEAIL